MKAVACLAWLSLGLIACHALTISGGTATLNLEEGMADSFGWLDAHFSDVNHREQTLSDPAPGDAPLLRLSGTPGTIGTSTSAGVPGTPGEVEVLDPIRPHGDVPDIYPGIPGASRSRQITTLDFDPTNVLGSWSASIDSLGILVTNTASSEQIALTSIQRCGGPFTGVLLYGDFALRYVPTRVGSVVSGGTLSGLVLTSNIDFLNSSWADVANAEISFNTNTLTISGDLLISGALNVLDPTAVVGTSFGTLSLKAIVAPDPSVSAVIQEFAVEGGTATLRAAGQPGSGYTVLSVIKPAQPITSWEIIATGTFAIDGMATNSFPTTAGEDARFFLLRQP